MRASGRRLSYWSLARGRHVLTLPRQGMRIITVHAESGGDASDRDRRASQLQYLARAHEYADGGACFLAGDFSLRQGEEHVLLDDGGVTALVSLLTWSVVKTGHGHVAISRLAMTVCTHMQANTQHSTAFGAPPCRAT